MNNPRPQSLHLGVMAKYWQAGQVKTRLGRQIGMEHAATLHRMFCMHLADQLRDAGDSRSFVVTPPACRDAFADQIPPQWQVRLQSAGDLGQRMRDWFAGSDASSRDGGGDSEPLRVLIGADCPLVNAEMIAQTQSRLGDHDVVLGPALDGGYYLIALRRWSPNCAALFQDIPWSTADVLELTCRQARQAGLRVTTLAPLCDVDTEDDLNQVREQLRNPSASHQQRALGIAIDDLLARETRR